MDYKESLNSLLQKLANIQPQNQNITNTQNSPKQFVQDFKNEIDKKRERNCEIVFWLSIVGVILSLFGYMLVILVYVKDFYYAIE